MQFNKGRQELVKQSKGQATDTLQRVDNDQRLVCGVSLLIILLSSSNWHSPHFCGRSTTVIGRHSDPCTLFVTVHLKKKTRSLVGWETTTVMTSVKGLNYLTSEGTTR